MDCTVAILDSHHVSKGDQIEYLSVREQAKFVSIPHPERRHKWLAGRLAAKYLFLQHMGTQFCTGTAGPAQPVLLKLTPERLRAFSPWMYRKIEVLMNPDASNEYPRFVWCGKYHSAHISLSHIATMSCAAITFGSVVGIDVEIPAPRTETFYRGNFTPAERQWVRQSVDATEISPHWLFTLLWTLKEGILKACMSSLISVWAFPDIDINILQNINHTRVNL